MIGKLKKLSTDFGEVLSNIDTFTINSMFERKIKKLRRKMKFKIKLHYMVLPVL